MALLYVKKPQVFEILSLEQPALIILQNGIQPQWYTITIEDGRNGRRTQWKNLNGRRPQWKIISLEDDLNGGRP